MGKDETPKLQEGHQLYDPVNGVRIGALSGALLGAAAVVVLGGDHPWLILVVGLVGAAMGYLVARRDAR